MTLTYQNTKDVDAIIKAAMRVNNSYAEGEEPEAEKVEEYREAFNDILDDLENIGVRFFKREWRTRTFEESSAVVVNSVNYRCVLPHTSVNATPWVTATATSKGDKIYPTTYNGYYYEAQGDGTTGATEPTFPINQDETVADNDLIWKCIPDNKPGVGKNYQIYWVEDDTVTTSTAWANNTTFRRAGAFYLQDDEFSIEEAVIRSKTQNDTPLTIYRERDWANIPNKHDRSFPEFLNLERQGLYAVLCQLYPIPAVVGEDGYLLRYRAALKSEVDDDTNTTSGFPDNWNKALKWMLASECGPENNVPMDKQKYIDGKAERAFARALKKDKPREGRTVIKSCY